MKDEFTIDINAENTAALIPMVNYLMNAYRNPDGTVDMRLVGKKSGMGCRRWKNFVKAHRTKLAFHPEGWTPPTIEERKITADAVVQKIDSASRALQKELKALGLTGAEINGAMAMRQFGQNRFVDAMQIVASNVFRTAMRMTTMQGDIEKRLEKCRKAIEAYGPFQSDERSEWCQEEAKLLKQYQAIGQLLNQFQDTWYQGSAQIALVEMRMRENKGLQHPTQRSNKPSFRPVVMDAEEVPPPTPAPENDEGTNQTGDATAAP